MAPIEDTAVDGENVEIQGEEEELPVRHAPDPGRPTAEELERHRHDHWPYRLWCEFCVKGRGVGGGNPTEDEMGLKSPE